LKGLLLLVLLLKRTNPKIQNYDACTEELL